MLDYHVHIISYPAISSAVLLFFAALFANEFRKRKLRKSSIKLATLLLVSAAGLLAGAAVDFREASAINENKQVLEQKGFQEWGGLDPNQVTSWKTLAGLCQGEIRLTDTRYEALGFGEVEAFSEPVRVFCRGE